MSLIADIQNALETIPLWKRLKAMPERMDALEKRLAALEGKPAKAPGKPCPSCGAPAFRVVRSGPSPGPFGALGAVSREYACEECQFTETRDVET